ncbi:amidase [Azoarcus sp. L1K30]|uniref:amidase n=1 Tax=Azoarcus sp. L1K30 TaxID=2820277 RepID=UPI001B83A8A4|nr:amidase [Azoarcus sp. L1K30]MBR0564627.1 amidase [Azoarcus sp. L1K30]
MNLLDTLSASRAAEEIAAGRLSAVDLFNACTQQITQHNPALNALVTLDLAGARRVAEAADAVIRQSGRPKEQPLLGIPISIKDAFATQGLRTTSSFPPLADYRPTRDATVVARLKAAGAVLLGKSNLSELAGDPQCWSPLFGPTRNPWDLARTPGGSSGGAAAAIAMGFSLLEAGSDIAGSIRIPAAYCGVTGLKATENRIPRSGHIPQLPGRPRTVRHLLSFGLLGRRVADLQLGFPLIAGPDGEDCEVPPIPAGLALPPVERPLRIAWSDDFAGTPLCRRTRQGLQQAVSKLQAAGHWVERCAPDRFAVEEAWQAFGTLAGSEIGRGLPTLQRLYFLLGSAFLPRRQILGRAFIGGVNALPGQYNAALVRREQLIEALEDFLGQWDVWLCPTAPTVANPAFPLSRFRPPPSLLIDDQPLSYIEATISLTAPFSLTGSPVVALPVSVVDDLPVGIQVVGRRWQEDQLLQHCRIFEECLGYSPRPPLAGRGYTEQASAIAG